MNDDSAQTVGIELLGHFRVVVAGAAVDSARWSRRHSAGLVKLLALAPGHRMHREQVIDALWPDESVAAAAPKLYKAAHFARRAIGFDDAVVVRGELLSLCPGRVIDVDAVRFEEIARVALADGDRRAARLALDAYGGELLPEDRYAEWAEEPRERLRLRHLDLLRLDERWDELVELDPSDEQAHVALMRRHVANGDHHGALRQFERLDRRLRTELGVGPGREAVALREELLASQVPAPVAAPGLVGRSDEIAALMRLVDDVAAGANRVVFLHGAAGTGKSSLLTHLVGVARAANFRVARGVAAAIEGGWPYAAVVESLADLCRQYPTLLDGLADVHRDELDRALAGGDLTWSGESAHQRLFVAAAELARLASATSGLLIVLDDVHDADDASLRLLHYLARSMRGHRVLLAIAHRPATEHARLSETRSSLIERHGALDLALPPLGPDDAAALARSVSAGLSDGDVDKIVELSAGVPFAVCELARRAADAPAWAMALDAHLIAGVDPTTREALQRVAVVGSAFDTDAFVALSNLDEPDAFDALDHALAAGAIEPTDTGYRFRHALVREALLRDVPPHRRRAIHRSAAERLIDADASPARIGHHLMEAGSASEAVPYLLRAAETEAAIGAYRDALVLVDAIRAHASAPERARALALRGDLLNALGDPMAVSAYREALDGADEGDVPRLRALLGRTALMSGDLDTAAAALAGLAPDGGEHDADILLALGNYAWFTGDYTQAASAAEAAEQLILAGQHNWKVLDLVALQGLLAHRTGNWFDRIRLELRRTRSQPAIANAIFDGHLCVTEFMLYGPTPYAEVIDLASELKRTANRSGAVRAEAFAATLIGEAALLSGDLDLADRELCEAVDLHRDLGSTAGAAMSMQRLAEVRIAQGRPAEATELAERALPLARASMVAGHLLQRIFGTLVVAAPDPDLARVAVDRAEATLGWDEECTFCAVMLAVPATIACARVGDLDHARRHLQVAEFSVAAWSDTSWGAAVLEARAAVAAAEGDVAEAEHLLDAAARGFDLAGQPLDAERCRRRVAVGAR